jgi:hypothetical protein
VVWIEIIDALPKFTKGKSIGKPKGFVTWSKVDRGGWVNTGGGEGYVERNVGKTFNHRLYSLSQSQYGRSPGSLLIDGNFEAQNKKREMQNSNIDSEILDIKREIEIIQSHNTEMLAYVDAGTLKENIVAIFEQLISANNIQISKLKIEIEKCEASKI